MSIKQAIEKAIEGGYEKWWQGEVSHSIICQLVLDKGFLVGVGIVYVALIMAVLLKIKIG